MLRRDVPWVYAPERGRAGNWHVHALLLGALEVAELELALSMWHLRNGRTHAMRVAEPGTAALYTTKEAAITGEVVWADSLVRYGSTLLASQRVALAPGCSPAVRGGEFFSSQSKPR